MGARRAKRLCPICLREAVSVTRNRPENPWIARCEECHKTWEYVDEQTFNGLTVMLASDGKQVYVLRLVDHATGQVRDGVQHVR